MSIEINPSRRCPRPEQYPQYIPLEMDDGWDTSIKEIVCSFCALIKSAHKCYTDVGWKESVINFKCNEMSHVLSLQRSHLINNNYAISPYSEFYIYEPKKRWIQATALRDRVFQRSLCDNYLYDELIRHFIYENVACQIGKGTDFGRDLFKRHLNNVYQICKDDFDNSGFVLKCDIHHFFESIDHYVLYNIVKKYVRDNWARNEVLKIINSYEKGIGLGSQISQLLALTVLTPLDHFIKENLKIKYYIRYMDDFMLIHPDKKYLQHCKEEINNFLQEKLKLELNTKKTQLIHISHPIPFLGFKFKVKENGRVIMRVSQKKVAKERRKLKRQFSFYSKVGAFGYEKCWGAYQSWRAHIKHGNDSSIIRDMDKYFVALYKNFNDIKGDYEKMHKFYTCYKNYEGKDVEGKSIYIPKEAICIAHKNYICVWTSPTTQHIVCHDHSDVAFNYFCQNDDDMGDIRGFLILNFLSKWGNLSNDTINIVITDNIVKQTKIFIDENNCNVFGYNFYNASIEFLTYINQLINSEQGGEVKK